MEHPQNKLVPAGCVTEKLQNESSVLKNFLCSKNENNSLTSDCYEVLILDTPFTLWLNVTVKYYTNSSKLYHINGYGFPC